MLAKSTIKPVGEFKLERLKEFPLFAHLSTERLIALETIIVPGVYAPGELLFEYGSQGDRLFFICRGTVTFSLTDNLKFTERFGTLGPGDCAGEVSLFGGGHRTADGRVTEEVISLEVRAEDIDKFLEACPEAARFLLQSMAKLLVTTSNRSRHSMRRVTDAIERQRSPADKKLARMVRVLASPWFLSLNVIGSGLWIIMNKALISIDPFPYPFLALVLSAEALVATLMILKYQNREEQDARTRDAAHDRAADEFSQKLDDLLKRYPSSPS